MINTSLQPERLTLKEYQASILARLESAKSDDVAQVDRYLGVKVGSQFLLVPMQRVKEAMSLLEIFPVPLAQPWLLGMANVRGTLYGITDLAYFFHGTPSQITSSSRILLLNDDVYEHVGLMVDQLIGIRRLEFMRVIENENQVAADVATVLEQPATEDDLDNQDDGKYWSDTLYEDMDQQRWQVFDMNRLINAHAFMHPAY